MSKRTKMRKNRLDYRIVYTAPPKFEDLASFEELASTLNHPHLNTLEYRLKPINSEYNMHNYYDHILVDENGDVTIACNKRDGLLWYGCVFGFDSFEDLMETNFEISLYRIKGNAFYTGLKFVQDNFLVLTQSNGSMQLISLYSDMRTKSTNGYSLFEIGNIFFVFVVDYFPMH